MDPLILWAKFGINKSSDFGLNLVEINQVILEKIELFLSGEINTLKHDIISSNSIKAKKKKNPDEWANLRFYSKKKKPHFYFLIFLRLWTFLQAFNYKYSIPVISIVIVIFHLQNQLWKLTTKMMSISCKRRVLI